MHHLELDRWSRGASAWHARDARAKLVLLAAFLVAVATTSRLTVPFVAAYFALLLGAIWGAGLPAAALLLRAAVVLPFSATFALVSWAAGDSARAVALVAKSYLCAAAVLVVVGATPLPKLLRSLEWLRVPRFLVLVAQFLYRYLFVISAQAQHMRLAAESRGGWRFRRAAGAVAVLFTRSYARAEGVHRAMLARGFHAEMALLTPARAGWRDWLFLLGGVALVAALRFGLEGVWSR